MPSARCAAGPSAGRQGGIFLSPAVSYQDLLLNNIPGGNRMSPALRPALAALAFASLLGAPAMAETVNFKASLNGASEVPPNQTKGTGTMTATYDTSSKKLSYKGSYSGLTGDATMAHFHGPAEPG